MEGARNSLRIKLDSLIQITHHYQTKIQQHYQGNENAEFEERKEGFSEEELQNSFLLESEILFMTLINWLWRVFHKLSHLLALNSSKFEILHLFDEPFLSNIYSML